MIFAIAVSWLAAGAVSRLRYASTPPYATMLMRCRLLRVRLDMMLAATSLFACQLPLDAASWLAGAYAATP